MNQALFTMIEDDYSQVKDMSKLVEFKPLEFLEKFHKKHHRNLYSKARRELEEAIELLKVIKG